MKELLAATKTQAIALTSGLTFLQEKPKEQVPINFHLLALPDRNLTSMAPFCVIHPVTGSLGNDQRLIRVALRFGLYQPAPAPALTELDNLVEAVWPLARRGNIPGFMVQECDDFFGVDETNQQPHPLYFYTLVLKFVEDRVALSRTW